MEICYRSLEATEVEAAADVFLTTLADLARRNGLPHPAAYTRANVVPAYAHMHRTGIFRVAEVDGEIVAICAAVVREHLWFLSMFWTLPSFQQQRVGGPLLRQVLEEGRARGATIAFTWSSLDFAAMATYMKLGMLPGCQIFTFAGTPTVRPDAVPGYALEPLDSADAARIDARVIGASRAVDHVFWRDGADAHAVRAGGEVVGYFYARGGVVGPAAWTAPAHGRAVASLALRAAGDQASVVRVMTAGVNHAAVALALECGLRLVGTGHLLRTASFGAVEQYLPSGPALF